MNKVEIFQKVYFVQFEEGCQKLHLPSVRQFGAVLKDSSVSYAEIVGGMMTNPTVGGFRRHSISKATC